jgi:hypothetical protein
MAPVVLMVLLVIHMFLVKNLSSNQLFKGLQKSLQNNQFSVEIPSLKIIGRCKFTESKDDLLCEEFYENSYNSFLMRFSEKVLIITKPNRTFLHEFSFKSNQYPLHSSHVHICGNDTYFCAISILSAKQFIIEYNVYGLHKNYSITKQYSQL